MSVSLSVSGQGNTKPVLKTRASKINAGIRWCFTLNNYSNFDYDNICAKCVKYCRYAIIGKERAPNTGTLHLQGYIEFRKRMRPIGTFGNPCIHWEVAKGTKEHNIDYCSKEDEAWIHPRPYKMELKEKYVWQTEICNLLNKEPDDRTITWVWEPAGCSGKTALQKYIFSHFKNVVVTCGKGADMKNGIVKYQEATQALPKIVLINIPRSIKDYISYSGIEEVKDMFFFSPKYEGGMVCGPNPHVICFANEPPLHDKLSADRWLVGEIISNNSSISWD